MVISSGSVNISATSRSIFFTTRSHTFGRRKVVMLTCVNRKNVAFYRATLNFGCVHEENKRRDSAKLSDI